MTRDSDQLGYLAAELDALEEPTTLEVLNVTRDYDAGLVAAEASKRALSGGGGGGAAVVERATATFDDAEIRAAPTLATTLSTGPVMVAAQGAGKIILPVAFLITSHIVTPYTIDGSCQLQVWWDGLEAFTALSVLLPNGLLNAAQNTVLSVPLLTPEATSTVEAAENRAVILWMYNPTDFTEGDPANTITATTLYTVVPT